MATYTFPRRPDLYQDLLSAVGASMQLSVLDNAFLDELSNLLGRQKYDEDQIIVALGQARDIVRLKHNDPTYEVNIGIGNELVVYLHINNRLIANDLLVKLFIRL